MDGRIVLRYYRLTCEEQFLFKTFPQRCTLVDATGQCAANELAVLRLQGSRRAQTSSTSANDVSVKVFFVHCYVGKRPVVSDLSVSQCGPLPEAYYRYHRTMV